VRRKVAEKDAAQQARESVAIPLKQIQ
jgi:hypothetical protein